MEKSNVKSAEFMVLYRRFDCRPRSERHCNVSTEQKCRSSGGDIGKTKAASGYEPGYQRRRRTLENMVFLRTFAIFTLFQNSSFPFA